MNRIATDEFTLRRALNTIRPQAGIVEISFTPQRQPRTLLDLIDELPYCEKLELLEDVIEVRP